MHVRSGMGWGAVLVVMLSGLGCAGPPPELGPPAGWTGTDTHWWRTGLDTTGLFRPMETLDEMHVREGDLTYAANRSMAEQGGMARQQFARAIKQSLIRIYRNQPEVVDSLFERHVVPRLAPANLSGEQGALLKKYKREGYQILRRHFLEPRTLTSLGTDVTVTYPDSLQDAKIGGSVRMQIYLDAAGEPLAIERLEGVHPVLDAQAMQATTRMRWQPAYLLRGGKSRPLASWARFKIGFTPPPS